MIAHFSALLLGAAALTSALPAEKRTVTALNTQAANDAHKADTTATRAFSSVEIKTSAGQCLFVNELAGDFRANLIPIQVAACDGSAGQKWDVITKGIHNNVAGKALLVNTLVQACVNFDDRRKPGNQLLIFSCGGRADGTGTTNESQLFPFNGTAGPLELSPGNTKGALCMVTKGTAVDVAPCNAGDATQQFTFGAAGAAAPAKGKAVTTAKAKAVATSAKAKAVKATTSATTTVSTVTASAAPISTVTQAPVVASVVNANPTTPVTVSRAGLVLNPSAAAEANKVDTTAVRAFTSVSIKDASGQCLFIDPTAGDFRENLIPIQLKACDGSANTKFDIITSGIHNNQPNSALIVSSVTNGCLNFDSRRAAGDTVITFSCGGRADGAGLVTDSQLFAFKAGETSLALAPNAGKGATCLVPNGGKLDSAACNGSAAQVFTIV